MYSLGCGEKALCVTCDDAGIKWERAEVERRMKGAVQNKCFLLLQTEIRQANARSTF
jgi:hypothetical protein